MAAKKRTSKTSRDVERLEIKGYPVSVRHTADGWWLGFVRDRDFSGVVSQERTRAKTLASLRSAIRDAIALYDHRGWPR
jgi:predicted RNase H-like HicB family nuclease